MLTVSSYDDYDGDAVVKVHTKNEWHAVVSYVYLLLKIDLTVVTCEIFV